MLRKNQKNQKNQKSNDSFTKIFIRQNIRENKKLLILLFVLQFFGIPSLILSYGIDNTLQRKELSGFSSGSTILYIIFIVSFAVASLLGIVSALRSFTYLHKKTQADKTMALPLSTKQRFAGSYISGLVIYIVPYIPAIVLSAIIFPVFFCIWGQSFLIAEYEAVFLIYAVIGLLTMIMLYTTTVFICSCCGSLLESTVYTLLLNAGIPLFVYILNYISYSHLPGIVPEYELSSSLTLAGTFGGLYKLINIILFDGVDVIKGPVLYGTILWVIKYILLIAVLIGLSFCLYKKRKAEDISKPFVHSFIYFIFIVTAVISIEGFCIFQNIGIIGIFVSLILYITLDLIKTRGSKRIKKHAISFFCYVFSIAASFAIVKISDATEGFGQKSYIPQENSIKSVTLSRCFESKGVYTSSLHEITLTDKDSIEQIIKMHQATIEYNNEHLLERNNTIFLINKLAQYRDDGFYSNTQTSPVEISYMTNTGKITKRSYRVPNKDWIKTLLILAENESMKKCTADDFDSIFSSKSERFYTETGINISIPIYAKYDGKKINTDIYFTDKEKINEIREGYRKDIMSVTREDLLDLKTYCIINGFYIPTCFKNTIAALNKYNVYSDQYNDYIYINSNYDITICKSSSAKETYLNSGDINTVSSDSPEFFPVKSYDKDRLKELIKVAEPNYYTYKDCYIFSINHESYIIPPEYSSVAEKFIETSDSPDISGKQ